MATKQRWAYAILLMSIIGGLLSGCSSHLPSPEQMDKSPFTGIPCAGPCWQGLVIGKSNENDVRSVLPTLTFIDQSTFFTHRMTMSGLDPKVEVQGVEITADCIYPRSPCLTLDVADDILTNIEIVLNYEIRLDKAVGYLGSPDYIGYQLMGAERVTCEVDLVWRSKQIVLSSEAFTGSNIKKDCVVVRDTGKVGSNLLILKARYISVDAIKFLLSTGTGEFFNFSGILSEK